MDCIDIGSKNALISAVFEKLSRSTPVLYTLYYRDLISCRYIISCIFVERGFFV